MDVWMGLTLAVFGLLGIGVGFQLWLGTRRWDRATSRFVAGILHGSARLANTSDLVVKRAALPDPVARYLRLARADGQPLIRVARFNQSGELRIDEKTDRWTRFEAQEIVTLRPPAFVWDARLRVAPGIDVRVRDAYIEGKGTTQVRFLSVLPIADEPGSPESNSGALYRYLAEAVWYPTALLPSAGVEWQAIDAHKALATLTDSGLTVSLEFHFNEDGEVATIYTPARYGRFAGQYLQAGWEGHFWNYRDRGGMRIPLEGEVGWHLPGGWWLFWKGRLDEIAYES